MGYGPWYRIGLSLGNCLILVAIIETGLTFTNVFHGIAEGMTDYMYGKQGAPPKHLATYMKENPHYAFLIALYVLQILIDGLLWLVIFCKVNKHIVLLWIVITISRTCMSSYLDIREEWKTVYEGAAAIAMILAFLWGTVLFIFKVITGIQVLYRIMCDEDPSEKIHPVGLGFGPIKEFYIEHLKQLSVILLISEIAINIHKAFNFPVTAFLKEAALYLDYPAPDEFGKDIAIITVVVNVVGLILLSLKSLTMRRSWIAAYVITILIHFCLFVYIVIDWTSASAHPQMFNGFVFVSLTHLIYKVFVLYVYFKSQS